MAKFSPCRLYFLFDIPKAIEFAVQAMWAFPTSHQGRLIDHFTREAAAHFEKADIYPAKPRDLSAMFADI